jgi:Fis family transcriptional regulator, factor for inversion stimulation protein
MGVLNMVTKKKNGQRPSAARAKSHIATSLNGNGGLNGHGRHGDLPLRNHAERALTDYFASLNGDRPAQLYDMVLREVEEPLFRAVLDYASGNQSQAAVILGINRGTLRKKLRQFGLSA